MFWFQTFVARVSCFYLLVIPLYCLSAIYDYIPYIFENGRISYLHSL